jgi:adenylate cyclase, class 1
MHIDTFRQNKKAYLNYNNFRKHIFSELSPRDSEIILYMLPWMLCLNDPDVPGYIPDLETPLAVHGISVDPKTCKRETSFRKILKIGRPLSIAEAPLQSLPIHGIYTIGSIGTISQTASSDCDIWVCIDKNDFSGNRFRQLLQKTNLIKDWLDIHVRIPVYFFICDVNDIRISNFGNVDRESAGSTQKNTLKEEFYRTVIMVAGKIPLWWLCFEKDHDIDYSLFLSQYAGGDFDNDDCIDLGPVDAVEHEEYFGAALWQFNKALTNPLKSIIKMLLLEMLLVSPKHALLCHQFRRIILKQEKDAYLNDPSMFTMAAILDFNRETDSGTFDFIKKCFYLRYEFKLRMKMTMKEIIGEDIFRRHPIPRAEIDRLNTFSAWPFHEQIQFGRKVFELLANIYKRVSTIDKGVVSSLNPQDMNVIGRKLSSCLGKKPNKISLLHRPTKTLNIPNLTFVFNSQKVWTVATQNSPGIVASPDIVYCLTYLIWNGIYQAGLVKMTPNPTSVTLQEISNLGERIRQLFGAHDVSGIDFDYFMEPEKVTKVLVVVNFEGHSQSKDVNDFCVIYGNHWGELFLHRFNSPVQFQEFVQTGGTKFHRTEMYYYIQRNSLYYEKNIERIKTIVTQSFSPAKK